MGIDSLQFQALFDLTPTPLMVLDRSLCFVAANKCYLGITSSKLEDVLGRYVFEVFPEAPEREAIAASHFRRALAGEETEQDPHPFAIARPEGGYQDVWWTTHHLPVRGEDGSVVAVLQHCRDVTEEVTAKRMRAVISEEYDHRVRNMLAKVSAVARRTANGASDLRQFIADFDPRIAAMARAHELLVNGGWEHLGLSELVTSELQPYTSRTDAHTSISGPNVSLSSHVAQALGMALHELATNAAKHGALSKSGGALDINWSVGVSDGALRLVWTETGVPMTTPPSRKGFGSTIIDRVLPAETGGSVERVFTADGMVCTVDIPVPTRT